jgi:hypothetical protein
MLKVIPAARRGREAIHQRLVKSSIPGRRRQPSIGPTRGSPHGDVLAPGSHITVSTSELALLIAMVAVFVAGLVAVSHFEKAKGERGV